jgi:hypothetical protein
MDNDSNGRRQSLKFLDSESGKELTQTFFSESFNGGVYVVANIKGKVTVKVINDNPGVRNAVVSGIFFGGSSLFPAPLNVKADTVSKSEINVSWSAVTGATSYTIERALLATGPWTEVKTVTTNSYKDTGLTPETDYFYHVSASNGTLESDFSGVAQGATAPEVTDPSGLIAPKITSVQSVSATQVRLEWTDKNADEDGFKLERSTDGVNFAQIATPLKGTSAYVDQNLTTGTKYYYKIRAYKGGNNSQYSLAAIANASYKFQPQYSKIEPTRTQAFISDHYANRVDVMWDRRNQIYYVGEPIYITNRFGGNWGGAYHYEIRNYWGEVVDQGTLNGTAPRANISEPGWYTLQVYTPGQNNGVLGEVVGGVQISILRDDARFPKFTNLNVDTVKGDRLEDNIMRAITGMGPQRHNIKNGANPEGWIADVKANVDIEKQYYLNSDPVRNRKLLFAFSGDEAKVTAEGAKKVAAAFKGTQNYFEGTNEPNFFMSPQQSAAETCMLRDAVKSVDPSAKVIGPGVVDIDQGYGLAWIDSYLAAGGKNCIDGISYHVYNNINGDVYLARHFLTQLDNVLAKYGLQNIERWQTEQGAFAANHGVFNPRHQAQWDMLMLMMLDQHGVPKEQNHLWYDKQGGFWQVPAFREGTYGSLFASPVMVRVMSEEVYGKKYVRKYDFGVPGNNLYAGNLYSGANGNVAMFISNGDTQGKVTLAVSGASSLKVVSAFGKESFISVVNGRATLDVPEVPVYVEFATNQTVEVIPTTWGPNLARQAGVTMKTSGNGASPHGLANSISKVNDGVLNVWYLNQTADGDPWMDNTPEGQQAWFEMDLPAVQDVKRVVVYSGTPWSLRGSILDYELQVEQNGQWVTVERIKEDPKTLNEGIIWMRTSVTTFYSNRSVFQHEFPTAIKTSKIRLLVHDVTYGGLPNKAAAEASNQGGANRLNLREIEIFAQ